MTSFREHVTFDSRRVFQYTFSPMENQPSEFSLLSNSSAIQLRRFPPGRLLAWRVGMALGHAFSGRGIRWRLQGKHVFSSGW